MKRCLCLLMVLMVFLCAACGAEEPESKTVSTEIGGQSAVVTFEPGTLSAGTVQTDKGIYTFAWDRSGALNIVYPDGSDCTYRSGDSWGTLASSPDFDPDAKGYISGMTMAWGIENAIDQLRPAGKSGGGNALVGLLLLVVGAFGTFAPRAAWYLEYGWRFRDAEPSDAALTVQVLGGVVLLVIGGIFLLAAIL